jgi:hypothetical protein
MNSLDLIPIIATLAVIAIMPVVIWLGIRRAAAAERNQQPRN